MISGTPAWWLVYYTTGLLYNSNMKAYLSCCIWSIIILTGTLITELLYNSKKVYLECCIWSIIILLYLPLEWMSAKHTCLWAMCFFVICLVDISCSLFALREREVVPQSGCTVCIYIFVSPCGVCAN